MCDRKYRCTICNSDLGSLRPSIRIYETGTVFPTLLYVIHLDLNHFLLIHNQRPGGPLVVVDRFGGTDAATFAALAALLRQLEYENSADVYACAKAVHWRRPGVWKSVEDVMRIYKMIDTHVAVAAAASAVVATTQRESVEQMELEAKSV